MNNNLISADFPDNSVTEVHNHLDGIKTLMPFLSSLSNEEKKTLFKPGEAYKSFITKAVNAITLHPEIMSGTFNIQEFKRDASLYMKLDPILQKIAVLHQAIEDTVMAAGSDALASALEVYDEVKRHGHNIPGLTSVADEMKVHFTRKRKSTVPVSED